MEREPAPVSRGAPRLSDGVVVLRPWTGDDAATLVRLCGDPTIAARIPVPVPYTHDDALAFLAGEAWPGHAHPSASFAVLDARNGDVVGSVGVHVTDPPTGVAQAGYWTASSARRRGFATRALRLAAAWASGALAVRRVELLIEPENLASRGVAAAAGFREDGDERRQCAIRERLADVLVYVLEEPPAGGSPPAA